MVFDFTAETCYEARWLNRILVLLDQASDGLVRAYFTQNNSQSNVLCSEKPDMMTACAQLVGDHTPLIWLCGSTLLPIITFIRTVGVASKPTRILESYSHMAGRRPHICAGVPCSLLPPVPKSRAFPRSLPVLHLGALPAPLLTQGYLVYPDRLIAPPDLEHRPSSPKGASHACLGRPLGAARSR